MSTIEERLAVNEDTVRRLCEHAGLPYVTHEAAMEWGQRFEAAARIYPGPGTPPDVWDAERAVIAAAESRRSACREAWDPLDRAVDALRAARSAASEPGTLEPGEAGAVAKAGISPDKGVVGSNPTSSASPTPRGALPTREQMARALFDSWNQACGNCPSTYVNGPEDVERERYLETADAALSLLSPHVAALERERDEAVKALAQEHSDVGHVCTHEAQFDLGWSKGHARRSHEIKQAEAERDAALAERDQHAADACELRTRLELAVEGATVWRERAEKAEESLRSKQGHAKALEERIDGFNAREKRILEAVTKALGHAPQWDNAGGAVNQLCDAYLRRKQAAPPPSADAAPIEACLSNIMDEPNNCADRDHIHDILHKHFPAADAGTGTISDEEQRSAVKSIAWMARRWMDVTDGENFAERDESAFMHLHDEIAKHAPLFVARRAKELLGGEDHSRIRSAP